MGVPHCILIINFFQNSTHSQAILLFTDAIVVVSALPCRVHLADFIIGTTSWDVGLLFRQFFNRTISREIL